MEKLEVAKKIVEHGSCVGQCVSCGDCPALKAPYCTVNWDKDNTLSGDEYAAARKKWFENWIKENESTQEQN